MKKIVFLILTLNLYLIAADKASFGLNINSDDLEIEARSSLAFTTNDPVYRNFFVDANFINADDPLIGLGFFVENSPVNYQNIAFAIGLRTIFTDYEGDDFTAIPIFIGAKARMYLGDLPKSHLGVKLAYAPSPLTFQDADSYLEYRVEVDMSIIDNVNVYLGYRNIDTDYDNKNINYNDAVYVGFKFVLN
ncbi:MAG: YfaZ family protein [Epsilonproteobacteria bacterium]|nr:YfaZ family protein [Campylobacterota bacterium]